MTPNIKESQNRKGNHKIESREKKASAKPRKTYDKKNTFFVARKTAHQIVWSNVNENKNNICGQQKSYHFYFHHKKVKYQN